MWLYTPRWLSLAFGAALYFLPFFNSGRLLWPCLATLFFAAILPASVPAALFLAFLFYLILGIKELLFIRRLPLYKLLIFLILALGFLNFFARMDRVTAPGLLLSVLGLALLFSLLFRALLRYEEDPVDGLSTGVLWGIGLLLFGYLLIATLFLPLNFFSQSALLLVGSTSLIELLYSRRVDSLSRREILIHASVLLAFTAVTLAANTWSV